MKTFLLGLLLVALCGCSRREEKIGTAAAAVVERQVGGGVGAADPDVDAARRNVRTVVSPSWQGAAGKK